MTEPTLKEAYDYFQDGAGAHRYNVNSLRLKRTIREVVSLYEELVMFAWTGDMCTLSTHETFALGKLDKTKSVISTLRQIGIHTLIDRKKRGPSKIGQEW